MRLEADGFEQVRGLIDPAECERIAASLATTRAAGAGSRLLLQEPWCLALAARLMAHDAIRQALPLQAQPVQCTFFEKSASRNWLVAAHQDLSIPVHERVDDPALSGWSEKEGVTFVHAPVEVLRQMLAARLHLDDCGLADGPLWLVPGSHALGPTDPADAARRSRDGSIAVPARQGDVLLMRPLTLHASSKSTGTGRRRVLHFLFGPLHLPHGLAW